MFGAFNNSLSALIYPQECRVCKNEVENLADGVACKECWAATRIFQGSEMLCYKCGAFFSSDSSPSPVYCHSCDSDYYDKAIAVGIYEKALSASIVELKLTPKLPARLTSIIRDALNHSEFQTPDIVVPVPLSKLRKLERGFNQAELISNELSKTLGLSVDSVSLARVRQTPIHRIGMDKKARELTSKNAFEVLRPKLIKDKNVVLVDDVFTSGATTSNCAKVLKKNGANRVVVFTLARAVLR